MKIGFLVKISGAFLLIMMDTVIGAPTVPVSARDKKELLLVPATRFVQIPVAFNPQSFQPLPPFYQFPPLRTNPSSQTRGPFDFIGNWIQQSEWFPIEINVPDAFQNIGNSISQIGNNVSQFGQNVGTGVSQFTQNVGNGFSQFTQNVGNGFNGFVQQIGQRVPFIGNIVGPRVPVQAGTNMVPTGMVMIVPVQEFPGGQQLVLAQEALESFP